MKNKLLIKNFELLYINVNYVNNKAIICQRFKL